MSIIITGIICFTALLCTVAVTSTIEKVARIKREKLTTPVDTMKEPLREALKGGDSV